VENLVPSLQAGRVPCTEALRSIGWGSIFMQLHIKLVLAIIAHLSNSQQTVILLSPTGTRSYVVVKVLLTAT
jgi:hypothetical protein